MNLFAKYDEIPSMILRDIKETKRYGHTHGRRHTHGRTVVRSCGQKDGRENSIPAHKHHKHSLRGGGGGGGGGIIVPYLSSNTHLSSSSAHVLIL